LGINPADGMLYVAAHNGVFRLPVDGTASRVGDEAQDTMGFTVAGPDHFLASGHPAPLQGGPDHLGLIESVDAGRTWRTLSLAGEADFHALRHRHETTYGYNSVTGRFMASADGVQWDNRSTIDLIDFAVSPTDPNLVLGTTETGIVGSVDGGRTWASAAGPPVVLLAWDTPQRLWGVTAGGELLRSADGGDRWSSTGQAPGAPSAFAADGEALYLAVPDEGVFGSDEAGASWQRRYP
ncbi:MAG: F510_1955 family glycosylhydrolase, partial [Natronosporangium sp.]